MLSHERAVGEVPVLDRRADRPFPQLASRRRKLCRCAEAILEDIQKLCGAGITESSS